MKVSFIFNNPTWGSIDQKVKNICAFFSPSIQLTSSTFKTYFTDIPFVTVKTIDGTGFQDGTDRVSTAETVSSEWFTKNISPLAIEADIIVFHITNDDKKGHPFAPTGIRGNGDPVQCIIFGQNENDRVYVNAVDIGNGFEVFAEHEISHALYLLNGKPDKTHQFFYSGNPKGVLPDFVETKVDRIKAMLRVLLKLLGVLKQKQTMEEIPQQPIQPTTPTTPVPEVLLWDKANARHSIRVLCDREGLSVASKNIITACIQQESQFDNAAIGRNKNKFGEVTSSDWGICQINDYYQIGPGKPFKSVEDVVNNPEKAVKFMIQMFKAGKLNLWVSYSSGAYKKWL